MKRSTIDLQAVADWHNLSAAFGRAAVASGRTAAVEQFRAHLDGNIATLRQQILNGTVPVGKTTRFRIRDPKPRIIHAPCFRERVLHHALIAHVGPLLDHALVDDCFACRPGKGGLAAVKRCQHHLRRFTWYVQIDIDSYFASIDQANLIRLLRHKFKNPGLLYLMERIIHAFQASPGRGLPIGALTSQHFANYYLAGFDRWLLKHPSVRGMVRYMDDIFWCVDSKAEARQTMRQARDLINEELGLQVKQGPVMRQSGQGALFCGYRVQPARLLLSRRRKKRYQERRHFWESQFERGFISAGELQRGYAAVLGITAHADASNWRREQMRRKPLPTILEAV